MPGLAQRNDQFSNAYSVATNGFWSKHRDVVSYNQLQKFWSELSPQARQELLRIDKQTFFEQARKNMYCSRCNGLLLEGFLQIVMYGKSLQQEGTGGHLPYNRSGASKNSIDGGSSLTNGCQDEIQDPSVHPWGGLTTTRDGSLTLLDCYLCSKSLKALQNVFDSARARERERELLYPDACGGGGRGWISQGIASYGRGNGTRETCALHTARLSCDTLVDFWSALGEETWQSLLRMKEEDFIERLMYRFDSKRFCRDCRRNVIREFKELKELKRMRRETHCTSWFCGADTAFQYEVSDDTVQADWRQTFTDTVGIYHHFEWAVGTGEGKSDILEFENVGMNGSVQVNGLDLGGICACYITLRAWKLDGRRTELSVKAHALKGQQCVHCRLVVGDGFVTISRGESIKIFFEHAEEAEEEEDDDSMDKDGNDLDGECSRPQKHAKSPELAREFLLDAATVIFKEQVEKAFREGTARQNAHSIFVCLALKLLEERVHVACREIITLEKQTKLLEEEEREKREEEERKERRRVKDREKKLRRKERLKGKERDRERSSSESNETTIALDVSNVESPPSVDEEPSNAFSCTDSVSESGDVILSTPVSPEARDEQSPNGYGASNAQNHSYDDIDGAGSFTVEQSKFSRRRFKFRKEAQPDPTPKWPDRRSPAVAVNKPEQRCFGESFETPSRGIKGSNRQIRSNATRSNSRNCSAKFQCSENRTSDRYDLHSCSCNQNSEYRAKTDQHASTMIRSGKPDSAFDSSKQFYRGNKYTPTDYGRESYGRPKGKTVTGNSPYKQVWEPMEPKKYPRSNSDSDITLRSSSTVKIEEMEPENSGSSSKISHEGNSISASSMEILVGAEIVNGEAGLCPVGSNSSNVATTSSASNSDNCSSCLSEGDSNTASSSHGNTESSSTSDSEDASQQSEGRETVCSIPSSFSEHLEETQNLESPPAKSEKNERVATVIPQPQGPNSPMCRNNQNLHFPVFQAPPAMGGGYYHQSPVSWAAAPANNGLMQFPHPNHYLYASPVGYGLNGDSPFCLQYGAVPPLFNPGHVPVYQPPPPKPKNCDEQPYTERPVPVPAASPLQCGYNPSPNPAPSRENSGFSLFHFGGPVAFSAGHKQEPAPDLPRDHKSSTTGETVVEEYNLFTSSNVIWSSIFGDSVGKV